MGARLRQLLLVLFTVLAAGLGAPSTVGPDTLADGVCNNGTHWDNIHNMCV